MRLKCTKFDFGWGSVPDPNGELTALLQTPWLDLRGSAFKSREGDERRKEEINKKRGNKGRRKEEKGRENSETPVVY